VKTLRAKSMRTELSYSRYNRQVTASGSAFANFKSILMPPFLVVRRGLPTLPDQAYDRPLS